MVWVVGRRGTLASMGGGQHGTGSARWNFGALQHQRGKWLTPTAQGPAAQVLTVCRGEVGRSPPATCPAAAVPLRATAGEPSGNSGFSTSSR